MSIIHHRQIGDRLNRDYVPHIDMSDVKDGGSGHHSLSRALAAFTLSSLADISPETAALAVTDGFQDNGIDALWYDPLEKTLFAIQSKWNANETGSISRADVQLFIQGIKDLLGSKKDRFNSKIQSKWSEVDAAISELRRLEIVVAYSGSGSFGTEPKKDLNDYATELNDTGEIAFVKVLNQHSLHSFLTAGAAGVPIAQEITLFDFGQTRDAIKAFYGQVAASDVAEWYQKNGQKIFSKNIRMFLGSSTLVNEQISKTLRDEPQHFWYLNNGITALATTISKRATGGSTKQSGVFDCEGFTIVNGAQTVGSIFTTYSTHPESVKNARVGLRIISLEDTPENFSVSITRANNTQNRIDSQNFVALDPEQERLRRDLGIDGINYEFRQSDSESSNPNSVGLHEATIALACTAANIDFSTEAKRELGKLWEDISQPPYKLLFNGSLTGQELWMRVQACRRIQAAHQKLLVISSDRTEHALTHGNRFLVWLVYNRLLSKHSEPSLVNVSDSEIARVMKAALDQTISAIDGLYPDSYIANIFKNRTKCREIAARIPKL